MNLTKSSDGAVSQLINRPISLAISGPLAAAGVSPNAASIISGLVGLGSAASYVFQLWWLGGVLIQLASILGGVDGEIARRTGNTSKYGDFLDTVIDRSVEYAVLASIGIGLSGLMGSSAWIVALAALGGTFLLSSSSEKYRSVMQRNYPKQQLEGALAYLASGRDVRLFIIAVASVLAMLNAEILFLALAAIAILTHLNFLYRVVVLRPNMS